MRRERTAIVLELIPPLVHRLNNSLAVLAGALEDGISATTIPARVEVRRLGSALRQLSLFAKTTTPNVTSFDISSTVDAILALVEPYASIRGVRLVARVPGLPAVLTSDQRRLEQLLVTLVAAEVDSVASDAIPDATGTRGASQRPVLRLTLCSFGSRLVLSLARTSRSATPGTLPPLLERAAECAGDLGMRVSLRSLRRGTAYRFVFRNTGEGVEGEPSPREPAKRLLLLEHDDSLSVLIEAVLVEAGFVVRTLRSTDGLSELRGLDADLLLIDADYELQHPGLLQQLCAPDPPLDVLLLGRPEEASSLPVLRKPFRPHELVDAVRGLLYAGSSSRRSAPSTAERTRPSTSSPASASSQAESFPRMTGFAGWKTVQQSGSGSIEVS